MRSTFYGLSIGSSGLFMSQKQIDVTGHNIANVDVKGYSRQRYTSAAVEPYNSNVFIAPVNTGTVGQGVKSKTLDQIRDQFLDKQYRQTNSDTAYWSTKSQSIQRIEGTFSALDESSLMSKMNNFFNSWTELQKYPYNPEYRVSVTNSALELTSVFQRYYSELNTQQQNYNGQVEALTKEVNVRAEQIADLNTRIFKYELSGEKANDLRDQRNLLIDQLSEYGDVDYKYEQNQWGDEYLTVYFGGEELVNHKNYHQIDAVEDSSNLGVDGDTQLYKLVWNDGNDGGWSATLTDTDVKLKSGEIQGYIDMRDGGGATSSSNKTQGVPYYLRQIDMLANSIVKEVNAAHQKGYNKPNSANGMVSETGLDFFDPAFTSARYIKISDKMLADKNGGNIATESKAVEVDPTQQTGGGLVADAIAKLWSSTSLPNASTGAVTGVGTFSGFFNAFIADLGTEVNYIKSMQSAQDIVLYNVDNSRLSVSGVSLDEEMTELVRFQHSYSASARVITAMDEALDVLINRMGRVGL